MKEELLMVAKFLLFGLIFFLIITFMFQFLFTYIAETTCLRLSDYGYVTQLEENIFDGTECFIYMEDGTKVSATDFNIADYKKPLSKGVTLP